MPLPMNLSCNRFIGTMNHKNGWKDLRSSDALGCEDAAAPEDGRTPMPSEIFAACANFTDSSTNRHEFMGGQNAVGVRALRSLFRDRSRSGHSAIPGRSSLVFIRVHSW